MKIRALPSLWGSVFSGIYLALVLWAALFVVHQLIFNTANSELSGVPLIVTTLPWSLILFRVEHWLHIPNHPLLAILNMVLAAGINTAAFYCVGAILDPALRPKP